MASVLILGGSILQLPLIKKSKEKGFNVILVDYNDNCIGRDYSDEFILESTNDHDAIYRQIKGRKDIVAVLTMATDLPMRTVSILSEKLKLKTLPLEVVVNSTDKHLMIKQFEKFNVNIPEFKKITKDNKHIKFKYPAVLKPTIGSGSRGVIYIEKEEDFIASIEYSKQHTNSNEFILEEYVVGDEVSVEVFVKDSKIHIVQITDKVTTGYPNFVELRHSQPSVLSKNKIKMIVDETKKAIRSLGITSGPAHVEIKVNENEAKLIEVGARLGGDFITSDLVPLSTDFSMVESLIDLYTNKEINFNYYNKQFSMINFLFTKEKGIIKSIDIDPLINKVIGLHKFGITKKVNDKIEGLNNSNDRLGYIITYGNTLEECENRYKESKKYINIKMGVL